MLECLENTNNGIIAGYKIPFFFFMLFIKLLANTMNGQIRLFSIQRIAFCPAFHATATWAPTQILCMQRAPLRPYLPTMPRFPLDTKSKKRQIPVILIVV